MRTVMTGLALMVSASTAVTAEPTKFQATLAGHAVLNATQIIVANDNNFPFSADASRRSRTTTSSSCSM